MNKPQVFKVKAETGSESSPESEVSDPIGTKMVIMAAPGKPCATNVAHNSVSLKWTIPPNRNSQLTDSKTSQVSKKSEEIKTKSQPIVQPYNSTTESITVPLTSQDIDPRLLLSPLRKPCATDNSVNPMWDNGNNGIVYKVSYHIADDSQKKWCTSTTTNNSLLIEELELNTTYLFKVLAECYGDCQESEDSDPIKTRDLSPPGTPYACDVTHDSIQIKWNKPEYGAEVVNFYKITYRSTQDKPGQWSMLSTTSPQECFTITGLQQHTAYVFQVSAVVSESELFKNSQVSDKIQTKVYVSKPGKPIATNVTCKTIELTWCKPTHGAHLVSLWCT